MVVVYPAIWWHWSPPLEYIHFGKDAFENIKQFILPAWIMGLFSAGTYMRMMRTTMLEVLRQDYIRTAWSKGLSERVVILRHALRNSLIPVITMIGLTIPHMVSGNVVMEQIFTLPGIGRYLIEAIETRDYSIIIAVNLVFAGSIMFMNLLTDLSYGWLDPRIRYK